MVKELEGRYLIVTSDMVRALALAFVATTVKPDDDPDWYINREALRMRSRLTVEKGTRLRPVLHDHNGSRLSSEAVGHQAAT